MDVDRSAQNQSLLTSMDHRSEVQFRLQKSIERLSAVAISYYAVNLVTYLLTPFAEEAGVPMALLYAGVTPVVIGVVWLVVQRLRKAATPPGTQ